MNHKRFFIIAVLVVIAGCTMLIAQNFGFTSDSEVSLTLDQETPDLALVNRDYFWLEAESKTLGFFMQGSYRATFNDPYFFDLDHLYFTAKLPATDVDTPEFFFAAGRFPVADFSTYVLLHTLDGIKFEYNSSQYTASATVGYSGLLWDNLLTTIEMSRADNIDKNNPDLHLQPPRLIGAVDVAFNEFLPFHTINLSYVFQQDFRYVFASPVIPENETAYDGTNGGAINTQYIGIGITGEPASFFFYDLFYYFGTGSTFSYIGDPDLNNGVYQFKPITSALVGASMRFYMEEALFSRIEFKGVYTSGDTDYYSYLEGNTSGEANLFVPISHSTLGTAFSPDLGNIFFFSLDYSFKPLSATKVSFLEELQTLFRCMLFFRSTTGPISLGGINEGSSSLFLGTELDAAINYRPASDLGFALKFGCFVPDNGSTDSAFDAAQTDIVYVFKFELSLSM